MKYIKIGSVCIHIHFVYTASGQSHNIFFLLCRYSDWNKCVWDSQESNGLGKPSCK